MGVTLSLILLILSLLVGVAAVGGDTWRPGKTAWRHRLTARGWVTVLCLGLTVIVGFAKDVVANREQVALSEALNATRTHAENLSTQLEAAKIQLEAVNRDVSDVQSIVSAECDAPPCWTAEEAIDQLLGSTKDHVDRKTSGAGGRTVAGWEYKIGSCDILVHFAQDVVTYFSFPIDGSCPGNWRRHFGFDINRPPGRVTVDDLLRALFAVEHSPDLEIATGCTNCGNWHDPYIEFRIPGPHAFDFFDRYVSVEFYDGSDPHPYETVKRFEDSLRKYHGYEPIGRMNDYCGVSVLQSVAETLGAVEIAKVGFGRRGMYGRANYPLDICNVGYTAR